MSVICAHLIPRVFELHDFSASLQEEFQMMNAYLQHGLKHGYFKPLLGRIYPLEEAAQAQTDVISNSGTCGRLTLKI